MNKYKEFYNKQQELSKAYKATPTQETAEYCKTEIDTIWKEITSNGIAFTAIFNYYADSLSNGNKYLDIGRDVSWEKDVPAFLSVMRMEGIKQFTFSSSWSSAIEIAWCFQQHGCTLEGLTEVYKNKEENKSPALLFTIN